VTDAVKQLEARLGVRLLQRTTRHVSPTLDGEAYYRRCLSILADIEDAEGAFAGAKPKGMLRVDVHGTLARHFVLPGLPAFLKEYPDIQMYMSEGDRLVDLIREGIDCVLRVGDLQDSDMIARRVALLEEVTCVSPDYIARFGLPLSIDDLSGHQMIGFWSTAIGGLLPLEFTVARRHPHRFTTGGGVRQRSRYAGGRSAAGARHHAGAALFAGGRPETRHARCHPAGQSADPHAGLAAIPTQPPAVAARARLHRLAVPRICHTAGRNLKRLRLNLAI
jgi:DNA-binding transcriptional LysR family regulator